MTDNAEPFGVTVRRNDDTPTPTFDVFLPHSCDTWDIAGTGYAPGKLTRDEAVAELETFIAEATAALAALRRGEPYGEEQSPWLT